MCPQGSLSTANQVSSENQEPPQFVLRDSPVSIAAYQLAASNLPFEIVNHSLRVYLYAKYFHEHPVAFANLPYPPPVLQLPVKLSHLLIACVLHDLGASEVNFNGNQRFEVCGADAAVALLESFPDESSPAERHDVWSSISLHTSPGIGERSSVMSRLVRLAVLTDFGVKGLVSDERIAEAEREFPRGEIEKILGDSVVAQALGKEDESSRLMKAPMASWVWSLVESHKEDVARGEMPPGGINRAFRPRNLANRN